MSTGPNKIRFYCPTCGFRTRLTKTGKIPKHVNVNLRVGYNLNFPVCDASGKKPLPTPSTRK